MPRHVFILFLAWIVPALVEVRADSWSGKSVDFSHGDLCVSPNGRFLQHTDGTPFLYLGDTAWELIYRLNEPEVELYMENRRAKGFTVIQTVILSELDGSDGINRPLINGSPSTPDPDYFKWVDRVLEIAGEKGLYVGLLPTWGDKVDKQWGAGPEIFDEANAREYGRWLGRRYADTPNIIWIIGGDRSGEGKNFTVWKAMAEGIKECDKRHLMTYHPQGEHSSSFWFHDETWLDFNMFQSGHRRYDQTRGDGDNTAEAAVAEDNWRYVEAGWAKTPAKPILDAEPSYEDIPQGLHDPNETRWQAADVRRYAYWAVFAGAFGHTYGHNSIMQMMKVANDGGYGATKTWFDAMKDPGFNQMQYLKNLMLTFPFVERVPDQSIVADENGIRYDRVIATRGNDYLLVYNYTNRPMKLDLSKISGAKKNVWWYSVTDGTLEYAGEFDSKVQPFHYDGAYGAGNDRVLIAVDATKDYITKEQKNIPTKY